MIKTALLFTVTILLVAVAPGAGLHAQTDKNDETPSLPALGKFVAGMDPLWQPWIAAGQMPKDDFFLVTVVRPSLQPKRNVYRTRTGQDGAVGVTLVGRSTEKILVQALGLTSAAYLDNPSNVDLGRSWDVIFSRPSDSSLELAWREIAASVCRTAGLTIETVREQRQVLQVNAEGTKILRREEIDWQDRASSSLRSVSSVVSLYGKKAGRFVIPAEWHSRLYVDTKDVELWSLSEEEMRRWLGGEGVGFTPVTRELELTRVKPRS